VESSTDYWPLDVYEVDIRAVGPEYGEYDAQCEAIAEMARREVTVFRLPRMDGVSTTAIIERIRDG